MQACLTTVDTTLAPLKALPDVNKLAVYLDRKDNFTLYDYIFLRRVSNAIMNCGD